MKVAAIVQARCGSTRFPNKVFADIEGYPLIYHVFDRLRYAMSLNQLVLATTTNPLDDQLASWAELRGITVFRGSETDVLHRYAEASKAVSADVVVRITADDPLKEPQLIDEAVEYLQSNHLDVVCNNIPPSYPEGLDVEVFTQSSLLQADRDATDDFEREHVTQYFYRNPALFRIAHLQNDIDLSHLRWTIDTEVDLEMVRVVYAHCFNPNLLGYFTWRDILSFIEEHPEVPLMNRNVARSAMYRSSKDVD